MCRILKGTTYKFFGCVFTIYVCCCTYSGVVVYHRPKKKYQVSVLLRFLLTTANIMCHVKLRPKPTELLAAPVSLYV